MSASDLLSRTDQKTREFIFGKGATSDLKKMEEAAEEQRRMNVATGASVRKVDVGTLNPLYEKEEWSEEDWKTWEEAGGKEYEDEYEKGQLLAVGKGTPKGGKWKTSKEKVKVKAEKETKGRAKEKERTHGSRTGNVTIAALKDIYHTSAHNRRSPKEQGEERQQLQQLQRHRRQPRPQRRKREE